MKLMSVDKEIIKSWGYTDDDFAQIERAMNRSIYTQGGDVKISRADAIKCLGREEYLSGICRSAFHFTAYRENIKGQSVHFDSSALFK